MINLTAQTLPSLVFECLYTLNQLERDFALRAPSVRRRNKIIIDSLLSEERINISAILPLTSVSEPYEFEETLYNQLPVNTELVPESITSSIETDEGITRITVTVVYAYKQALEESPQQTDGNFVNIAIDTENKEAILTASYRAQTAIKPDGSLSVRPL